MPHLLLIALGGALGAVARHLVNQGALRVLGPELPWGTLIVNVAGSLAIGVLVGWLAFAGRSDATELRFALGVGFLGAFTTMSAFSLDVVLFIERKAYVSAALYSLGTLCLSVAAVFAGLMLARKLIAP
ncbi:MAG: fluoride efflux transporter CrcB [Oceanicaulis sp.]